MSQTTPDGRAVVRALDALLTQVKRIADHTARGSLALTPAAVDTDDGATTADDGPKPDFTSPIAGRIEVRQPCPYCVAPTMIPSTLLTDHIARLHNVGLATYGPYPAADEDAQRTTRRASLHNLIVHATQGALTTDECAMLWQHVEAEQREADTARADADRLEEETIGELNEVATRLARENEQLRADRDRLAAELEDVETRATGFLAERDQAQAALDRVRHLVTGTAATTATGTTDYDIGRHDLATEVLAAFDGATPGPAAAEATEAETTTRVFAALHRSAEQDVTRVIALYEQWVTAGAPPLGTLMSRWWDARLVELHDAIRPPEREQEERPTHPDGAPYRYHEIVAEGWEHCDGCHRWGRGWTPEQPHRCTAPEPTGTHPTE